MVERNQTMKIVPVDCFLSATLRGSDQKNVGLILPQPTSTKETRRIETKRNKTKQNKTKQRTEMGWKSLSLALFVAAYIGSHPTKIRPSLLNDKLRFHYIFYSPSTHLLPLTSVFSPLLLLFSPFYYALSLLTPSLARS